MVDHDVIALEERAVIPDPSFHNSPPSKLEKALLDLRESFDWQARPFMCEVGSPY